MGIVAWLLILFLLPMTQVRAQDACPGSTLRHAPPVVNFRVDNDLFGGDHQDQGYTNGALLTLVSPNLVDYTSDPCLPALARWVNRHLERLHPGEFEQQNMLFSVGQALFTPTDNTRRDLIADDRPYAAVLLVNIGYHARSGSHLRTTQLALGMVGPLAQGRQVQQAVHHLLGDDPFQGWHNQLHNEPVFRLLHARLRRWPNENAPGDWDWDVIGHTQAAIGNLASFAGTGAELRFGWKLPDDFGSSPLNPAGENTAPTRSGRRAGWSWHLFVLTQARWVLRDISLDGNTFRNSHHVHKRPFVGDVGYGMAVTRGRWKFAFVRYHRSREFDGQQQTPVFGSFTISRTL